MELLPHQVEAIAAVDAAARRGVQRQLIVLPTGVGKSLIGAEVIRSRGGRSLWLAHREELLSQAVAALRLSDPQVDVGVVQGGSDDHHHAVVVASVPTLAREIRLNRLTHKWETVVIDESHHAPAVTYRRILDRAGAFIPSGPLVVGLTATPD